MKKVYTLIAVLAIIVSISSCANPAHPASDSVVIPPDSGHFDSIMLIPAVDTVAVDSIASDTL